MHWGIAFSTAVRANTSPVRLPVPITSQLTKATAAEPFLALSLKLKPSIIAEFLADAGSLSDVPFEGMGVGEASPELLELVVRLLRLLGPSKGPQGVGPPSGTGVGLAPALRRTRRGWFDRWR